VKRLNMNLEKSKEYLIKIFEGEVKDFAVEFYKRMKNIKETSISFDDKMNRLEILSKETGINLNTIKSLI
jgi:hypothetical protein